MTDSVRVALVYCDNYNDENVEKAVREGIDLLGGAGQFVTAGEKILVKPNILVGSDPGKMYQPSPGRL